MIFRLFETKVKLYEVIVESQLDEYVVSFPSDLAAKKMIMESFTLLPGHFC